MVTLKDVALAAGVSIRTVSNVVNDWPHVRPELRARVQRAIDELGYRPNLAARNLRAGRSGLVGLLVPEIDSPYFGELARHLIDVFRAHGVTVVIEQTGGTAARERELLEGSPRAQLYDGILFSPVGLTSDELQAITVRSPIVLLGEQHRGESDYARIDNVAAAFDATKHLIDTGRARIALVGRLRSESNTSLSRIEGYRAALESAGLQPDDALIPMAERFTREEGARLTRALLDLDERPDAFFCLTDVMAVGCLRELRLAGVGVPGEASVIGIDDIQEGRFSSPTLSTVAPDKLALAEAACELLISRVAGSRNSPTGVVVAHQLLRRESTARLRSGLPADGS